VTVSKSAILRNRFRFWPDLYYNALPIYKIKWLENGNTGAKTHIRVTGTRFWQLAAAELRCTWQHKHHTRPSYLMFLLPADDATSVTRCHDWWSRSHLLGATRAPPVAAPVSCCQPAIRRCNHSGSNHQLVQHRSSWHSILAKVRKAETTALGFRQNKFKEPRIEYWSRVSRRQTMFFESWQSFWSESLTILTLELSAIFKKRHKQP
jgi:hypothetical protein